jgi:hypothetical protein
LTTPPNDPYGYPGQQPPSVPQNPPQYGGQYPAAQGPAPYGQYPAPQNAPQYGAQYPAPPPYGQYPPSSAGTNGLAIAGFVLSFLCSILGLIFSIIGLNQAKARGQGGQGLAIAGIIISSLSIIVAIALIASN